MTSYDYYRIFYYVARYKNFTKAGTQLKTSQSNITRCMNNLETGLQCKLFLRTNRGVTLTQEGRKLYEHIAVAYEHICAAEEELSRDRSLDSGQVTIGASETALRLYLLPKLEVFHKNYPRVRLRISNHSTPQAIRALENGLIDFAVVTTPIKANKPLKITELFSFREILLGGSEYTKLASTRRSLEEITDIPFISLGDNTGTREIYMQYFLKHGLFFQPDIEAATTDQILPMIQYNLGIGFYPENLAGEAIAKGDVQVIQLVEPLPDRSICLIQDTSHSHSIAATKLESALMQIN